MFGHLAAAAALTLGLLGHTSTAEEAELDTELDVQASCYGGAESFLSPGGMIGSDYFWASDRCNDINLRVTTPLTINAQVCFMPVNGDSYCNESTRIAASDDDWHVIATNVLPGTMFSVRSTEAEVRGEIAY